MTITPVAKRNVRNSIKKFFKLKESGSYVCGTKGNCQLEIDFTVNNEDFRQAFIYHSGDFKFDINYCRKKDLVSIFTHRGSVTLPAQVIDEVKKSLPRLAKIQIT